MLTQILEIRSLSQQPINLLLHLQLLMRLKVATGQLLLYAREHLQCACVLQVFRIYFWVYGAVRLSSIVRRRRWQRWGASSNAGPVTWAEGAVRAFGVGADDGCAALGGEGRFGRGFADIKTPC